MEEIRRAALGLFARAGYAAVSMRDIARAVGLQPSALYHYHATKQDLLRELMAGHLEALAQAWEKASPGGDPVEELAAFVRFHIRYHAARADEVFLSYMELRSLEPENFRAVEALRQRYENILRAILERGARQGDFEVADVPVAAMALIAMLTGVTAWYRAGGRLSVQEIEDIYVRMALGSVGIRRHAGSNGSDGRCLPQA